MEEGLEYCRGIFIFFPARGLPGAGSEHILPETDNKNDHQKLRANCLQKYTYRIHC
jgi:hypothetical protein